MEALIIAIITILFLGALIKTIKNLQASKNGQGCAGCQIADTCQKNLANQNKKKAFKK